MSTLRTQDSGVRTRFAATFRALHNRNYRLYWGGQLVSLTGGWVQRTAMAWLVLQLSDSPLALGAISALQFVPFLVFSLVGGVLADRWPKRPLLIAVVTLTALQMAVLAWLVGTGAVQLWQLYAFSLLQGVLNAVESPSRGAFVMELVGRDHLANAVALNSGAFNLSRVLGPSLAGVLIAAAGTDVCFWVNAAAYVPALAALVAMRPAEFHAVPPPARGAFGSQLGEGLRFALRTPAVFGVLIMTFAVGAFGFTFATILPLLARYGFNTGPEGYGLLSSSLGLGSCLSALLLAGQQRANRRVLLLAGTVFVVVQACAVLSPWFAVTTLLMFVVGAASLGVSTTAQTLVQYAAPGQMRGRVMSLYMLIFLGMTPLGALANGAFAEVYSVRVGLLIVVGICGAGTLATWLYLRYRLGPAALGAD